MEEQSHFHRVQGEVRTEEQNHLPHVPAEVQKEEHTPHHHHLAVSNATGAVPRAEQTHPRQAEHARAEGPTEVHSHCVHAAAVVVARDDDQGEDLREGHSQSFPAAGSCWSDVVDGDSVDGDTAAGSAAARWLSWTREHYTLANCCCRCSGAARDAVPRRPRPYRFCYRQNTLLLCLQDAACFG